MLQRGLDSDFLQKTVGVNGFDHLTMRYFYRDATVMLDVVRCVDSRHRTATELTLEPIASAEHCAGLQWHGHGNLLPKSPYDTGLAGAQKGASDSLGLPRRVITLTSRALAESARWS
jgi:hypothetical protein